MIKLKLTELQVRWIGIFLLAFLVMFVEGDEVHKRQFTFLGHYFISLSFCALYWNGAYMIFMYFRKRFPQIKQTYRRLILTYLVLVIWMTVGGLPLKAVFGFMDFTFEGIFLACSEYFFLNFVLAGIIGTIYETVYFFEMWKHSIQQNEELKNRQIRTQFEVLQNQMSPHFLFNSLNTLTALIGENPEIAIKFTEQLSEVYRYILQNKDRELVTLEEELEFAESYLFLLKMRFPDNLQAAFEVPAEHRKKSIAPLTIQMLIENAIKHNVVSKAHPLHISVYVDNGKSIIVKNNLQKKQSIEKSTQTGLNNIRKRYELLGKRKIDVIETPQNYMVAIPLIDVISERNLDLMTV